MISRRNDLIFLTGFMASGKSTLGPILANTLGFAYRDLDVEIERTAGKTIARIFAQDGEKAFRELERRLLTESASLRPAVISLGGGTIAHGDNIEVIVSAGLLVYLRTEPEQIYRRLRNKTNRPMILDNEGNVLPEGELRARIAGLLAEREPYYKRADLTVDTDGRRIGLTVDELVRRIRHR